MCIVFKGRFFWTLEPVTSGRSRFIWGGRDGVRAPECSLDQPTFRNDFKGHTANSLPQDKPDIPRSLYANTHRVRPSKAKLRSLSSLFSATFHRTF